MPRVRRHDLSPRVEMLPLIDVVFLLLTFFIYAMVLMIRPELLPVQLVPVASGAEVEPAQMHAITIDTSGQLHLDRRPIEADVLDQKLRQWAKQDDPPRLLLAAQQVTETDEPGEPVDRLPILIRLMERVRAAGLENVGIVGGPGHAGEAE